MKTSIKGTTDGHKWEAHINDMPFPYGIKRRRIIKLKITTDTPRASIVYNYNQGLTIDRAPAGLVDKIVEQLPEAATGPLRPTTRGGLRQWQDVGQ